MISGRPWFNSACLYQGSMVQRLRCLVVVQEIGVRFPVESPNLRDVVQGKDACFGSRRTQVRILSSRPFAKRMYRSQSTALSSIGEGRDTRSRRPLRLRLPLAACYAFKTLCVLTRFVQWQGASLTKKRRVFDSLTGDHSRSESPATAQSVVAGCAANVSEEEHCSSSDR